MLAIMGWMREKVSAMLQRLRRRQAKAVAPPKPPPIVATPPPLYDDRHGYVAPVRETYGPVKVIIQPAPEIIPPAPEGLKHVPDAKPEERLIGVTINRAERRALERRRRRHDKFVQPKGELPEKPEREPPPLRVKPELLAEPQPEPEPEPEPEPIEDAALTFEPKGDDLIEGQASGKYWIHGKHHEDTQDVLYDESEFFGEFNFRDTILQQLERYFVYLARMKKYDPDAFVFYKQYGAMLLPYVNVSSHDREGAHARAENRRQLRRERNYPLSEWFHQMRPSFGCFAYGADPETERYEQAMEERSKKGKKKVTMWVPKFMYFTKHKKPPPEMQMMNGGDIYSMTIWWDHAFDPKFKYGVPQEFGMFVSADGQKLVALRMIDTKMMPVWSRKKREYFHVPKRAWHIPSDFERWAKDNNEDPQSFLTAIFKSAVARHANSQRGIVRIAVHKDDMTAVFTVNEHKMGYFFQDRDIYITENGSRRRIFHMVRAHTRSDGAEVPLHFRGQRDFTWAGYDVSITVPGYDHPNFDEVSLGTMDEYWMKKEGIPKRDYLNMDEFGKRLAERIKDRSWNPNV